MKSIDQSLPAPAMRSARVRLPLVCLAGVLGHAIARPAAAAPVALGGTGSGLAPVRRLAGALHLDVNIVPNLGSRGGIKALAGGAIDLALSSWPLTDAERAAGLVQQVLFRTPFVWAVHPATMVQRVTLAELALLYGGRTERWPGGETVRLVLRPDGDIDTHLARGAHPDLAQALAAAARRPGMRIATSDDEAVADIERIGGALGVASMAIVRSQERRVRVLELDGVAPSAETLMEGRYRHVKVVHAVTRGEPSATVQRLLHRLSDPSARTAWLQLGCVPLAPE